jgi:hypothetical protein
MVYSRVISPCIEIVPPHQLFTELTGPSVFEHPQKVFRDILAGRADQGSNTTA